MAENALAKAMKARAQGKLYEAVSEKAGKEISTAEDLIGNIEVLAETKQVDGVDRLYLPLEWKKELFRLAYPTGLLQTEVTWTVGKYCNAVTSVYIDGEIVAEGQACQAVSLVPAFSSVDTQVAQCESIARGRAESKALYNAGIASWIRGDIENTDRVDEDRVAPEPVDKTEDVKEKVESIEEKKAAPEPPAAEEVSEPEEIPFEETTPDYRFVTIHGGKYDGKTIGDLETENPNLLFKMLNKHLDENSSYRMSDELYRAVMEVGKAHRDDELFKTIMRSEGVEPEVFAA